MPRQQPVHRKLRHFGRDRRMAEDPQHDSRIGGPGMIDGKEAGHRPRRHRRGTARRGQMRRDGRAGAFGRLLQRDGIAPRAFAPHEQRLGQRLDPVAAGKQADLHVLLFRAG